MLKDIINVIISFNIYHSFILEVYNLLNIVIKYSFKKLLVFLKKIFYTFLNYNFRHVAQLVRVLS